MHLQHLHTELLHSVLGYMEGTDILFLSLTNKSFYQYLGPFRAMTSAVKYRELIWPVLYLTKQNITCCGPQLDELLMEFKKMKLTNQNIVVESSICYGIISYLPKSLNLKLIIDSESVNSILESIFENCRITELDLSRKHLSAVVDFVIKNVGKMKYLKELNVKTHLAVNWKDFSDSLGNSTLNILAPPIYIPLNECDYFFSSIYKAGLKELNLSFIFIDGDTLAKLLVHLPHFKSLETLKLERCGLHDVNAVDLAKKLPESNIQQLELVNNELSYAGLEIIFKALPLTNIHLLDIENNDLEGQRWARTVHISSRIRASMDKPYWDSCQKAITRTIAKTKLQLYEMSITNPHLERFLKEAVQSKLKKLVLMGCLSNIGGKIELCGDDGAIILSKYVNQLPINKLVIFDCDIAHLGFVKLFNNLTKPNSIQQMVIDSNSISANTIKEISSVIPLTFLYELTIRNADLTDEALEHLGHSIALSRLKVVKLSGNTCLTAGGILKFIGLIKNTRIHHVEFKDIFSGNQRKDVLRKMFEIWGPRPVNFRL
ncbi:hypothetical protein HK103_000526 [Boothiomyces macroporosus]|uniref:F-box domain-containing protein n=1 Tax=Boothiomyces macroporosus TaxID=261099 RepID=A0AAD5UBA0_9FUNG|nr:hypothetical protein HK103_000526 [Boothiomyces macroporosus]